MRANSNMHSILESRASKLKARQGVYHFLRCGASQSNESAGWFIAKQDRGVYFFCDVGHHKARECWAVYCKARRVTRIFIGEVNGLCD